MAADIQLAALVGTFMAGVRPGTFRFGPGSPSMTTGTVSFFALVPYGA